MGAMLSGIGVGIGVGAVYSTVSEMLRSAVLWQKWKMLTKGYAKPIICDLLQSMLNAQKDPNTGITTSGMVDSIISFIDRSIDFSMVIDEATAHSLFTQMIHQSIAYAVRSAQAGSISTVANVYSGSESMSKGSASGIGEIPDLADRGQKSFLGASAGLNIPTTAFEVAKGANTRISAVYKRIIIQTDSLVTEWNELALGYYRHYHTLARSRFQDSLEMYESIVKRTYGFLEYVANDHLANINAQLDTLAGAKAWYDSGLMSLDELKQIALRVDIERQASEQNFDNYVDELTGNMSSSLSDWDDYVGQALDDMDAGEERYAFMLKDILNSLFVDVKSFVAELCDEADKIVEDICAYRNVSQSVKINMTDQLGVYEMSPETEVFRLRYQQWKPIGNYTVIDKTVKPRGLSWLVDTEHDKGIVQKEVAHIIPRRRFTKIGDSTVVDAYVETPLTPWVLVE
jgi:hypothetical protein